MHVAGDVPEIPDSNEPSGGRPFPKPRARRRRGRSTKDYALAQLRGYWEPEEVEDFEKDAATVLAKALNGLQAGLADRVAEEEVLSAWNDLVGSFVAEHSQPIRLDRKTLYVQVLQSAIHYTLERQKADLLQKLQTRFGARTIRQLRFRVG